MITTASCSPPARERRHRAATRERVGTPPLLCTGKNEVSCRKNMQQCSVDHRSSAFFGRLMPEQVFSSGLQVSLFMAGTTMLPTNQWEPCQRPNRVGMTWEEDLLGEKRGASPSEFLGPLIVLALRLKLWLLGLCRAKVDALSLLTTTLFPCHC